MVSALAGLFIKNKDDIKNPKVRQKYGMLCGIVGILLNIMLFAGKFLAGTISKSISITADAFNNLSDAGSSVITLIGFHMSGAEPDVDHPFGHGRIEYISGLIVSGIILIMAFELLKSSVIKIIHPQPVEFSMTVVIILCVSIAIKLYMAYYNRTIGKKIESAAMGATAADSLSDSCATAVVLAAAVAGELTGLQIDGYCGVLVGVFIFYAGINAARDTLNPLLGQPPEQEFVNQIEELVLRYSEVRGIHDLIVHDYGPGRIMISLHAEVPAEGDILNLHDVIDNIEHELRQELKCEAVIHMDPIVTGDEKVDKMKAQMREILTEIDEQISMHDFRVVTGPTHTNLIFDIAVPVGYKVRDEELIEMIQDRTRVKLGENYFVVIEVDKVSYKQK